MVDNIHKIELEKQWHEIFPSTFAGLFSFYQCLCTIAIVGCEIGSMLIDLFNATIYVGLWASLFFIIAWISQIFAVTCHRTRNCATYTFIMQCIALVFAMCVIGFDAYFLINPSTCFFSSTLCNSTTILRGLFYTEDNFNNIKIPLIKGQLATAAIMFAFSIDYMILYLVTHTHIKKKRQSISNTITNNVRNKTSTSLKVESVLNTDENQFNASSIPFTDRNVSLSAVTMFEPSLDKSIHRSRWSVDSIDLNPVKI